MKIKLSAVFFIISFLFTGSFAQSFSIVSDDEIFQNFDKEVSSYENALILIVQTFDVQSRLQTRENISVSVVPKGERESAQSLKTPYCYVIADYKDFKDKYDFATANEKSYLLKEYPDRVFSINVEAGLDSGKMIEVVITEKKKTVSSQRSSEFPFRYSTDWEAKYSKVFEPNTDLENIKDYYSGPRFIKNK